jgi:hypothetical protein
VIGILDCKGDEKKLVIYEMIGFVGFIWFDIVKPMLWTGLEFEYSNWLYILEDMSEYHFLLEYGITFSNFAIFLFKKSVNIILKLKIF